MRGIALALGLLLLGAPIAGGAEKDTSAADFLYRLAAEYRKAGRNDEAMHELHKVLMLDPQHEQAKRDVAALEQAKAKEQERAIEEAQRRAQAEAGAREEAMERAIRQTQQPPETPLAPKKQRLADRLPLPKKIPLGLEQVVSPAEGGRPEILSETKRAGFQRLYKEGVGFQPVKGLGFSARTEIFEEPNPVDDYILEAKIENFDSETEFRRSITPLFTRSWAARAVADYEPWPRLTYEFDKRDILHELEARFAVKDRRLETHAFNALYTFPRIPLLGSLTVNPWYKRVFQEADDDAGSFEDKDELVANFSLQPTDDLEFFFQYNTLEAEKTKTDGGSVLQLFKGQVRMRFPQWKLFVIPSYEYSATDFLASEDELVKRDLFVDWGFDITPRLRASSKERYVFLKQSQVTKSPTHPEATAWSTANTLSYELFRDFDVSLGVDYAKGVGLNAYDNLGLRTEMELFKPGIIRAKLGYEWLSYYNIHDDLSLLYLRIFLFQ